MSSNLPGSISYRTIFVRNSMALVLSAFCNVAGKTFVPAINRYGT